jgi:hypothetical protein
LREQKHLGDDFGCLWIVVREGEKESAAVLRMHGKDAQGAARLAMHIAATEVDIVGTDLAVDEGIALI